MNDTKDTPPPPRGASRFASALEGMAYDPTTALEKAIWAWADHAEIPHAPESRNRIACAMFAALAIYLESVAPEEMGWLGLKNREFADKLQATMEAAPSDSPPGSYGALLMRVFERNGMVALQYTDDVVVALPTETASILAEGLLRLVAEIEGKGVPVIFNLGVPPHDPLDPARESGG
jgi:hypothetical protein